MGSSPEGPLLPLTPPPCFGQLWLAWSDGVSRRPSPGGTAAAPLSLPLDLQRSQALTVPSGSPFTPYPDPRAGEAPAGGAEEGAWPAAADPTASPLDGRGSPGLCGEARADPGARGGRACVPSRPITAAPSPHWSQPAGGAACWGRLLPRTGWGSRARASFRPQFPKRGGGSPSCSSRRGRGAGLHGPRGRGGPRVWRPLPAARKLPQLRPRHSLEPLGSPVTSPPDYALTRLQPHFLGGGEASARAGEGASVGVRRRRASTPPPGPRTPPPPRPPLRPGESHHPPRPDPARPLPPTSPASARRRCPDALFAAGAGRGAPGGPGTGAGRGAGVGGGGEAGRGRSCPGSRPRAARAPTASQELRPVLSSPVPGAARPARLLWPPSAVLGPRHAQPVAVRLGPAAAAPAAPGGGRARPAQRRRDVPGARAGAAGGGGERGAHRHRGGDSQRGPGATHVLEQGGPPPGP